ncbi:MAG: hypothetical protein ACKVJK_00160 [Methylophagaceae bacterium]
MGKSKSAQYYEENPEARKKKNAYNRIHQRRPAQVKKRVEANRFNRQNGTYGNGDNKDASHQPDGSLRQEDQSTNRARGGGQRR